MSKCLTLFLIFGSFLTKCSSQGLHINLVEIETFVFWPNASVPFYIDPEHFDVDQALEIRKGLAQVAFKTCIKFAPVLAPPAPDQHVMIFTNPEGLKRCKIELESHYNNKPHEIVVGYECLKAPEINMIILRALGLPFEHNRMIRDNYIDVKTQNIEPHYISLFTKDSMYPKSIESMAYDINSVMHFGERDYSKNGYRTIVFKVPVTQNRNALTRLDIMKLNLIYGTQCQIRDRAEKIDICQSFPRVGRRKREISEPPANMSLRVNPNITPPPHIIAGITDHVTENPNEIENNNAGSKDSLKILAIEKEVDKITELVNQLSALALKNANEKFCNISSKTASDKPKTANKTIDALGVLQIIKEFAKIVVDDAVANATRFCQNSDTIEDYQRQCKSHNDSRCSNFFKSKSLTDDHQVVVINKDVDVTTTLEPKVRRKRETTNKVTTTISEENKVQKDKDVKKEDKAETNLTDKIKLMKEERLKEIQKVDITSKPELVTNATVSKLKEEKAPRRKFTDKRYSHDASDWEASDTSLDKKNLEPERTLNNKELLQKVLAEGTNAILRKEKEMAETERAKGNAEKRGKTAESSEESSDSNDKLETEEASGDKKANKVPLEEIDVEMDDEPRQRNEKTERTHKTGEVPKTVKLTKLNQEFYHERKWPDGDVIYVIAKLKDFDLEDVRKRLEEVNKILLEKTCVRLREVDAKEAPGFDDYIILDNSPDYVTGRVGRKQNFGCIELFEGGQHRQHAAMVVMAMLGFYFEVSRHDRDKHIRVHNRHIRADKLHHFEKLNEEVTLNIPYDYKSATHPAWQFWRKVGHKGISTVATFKDMDPDGSIMRGLGQNPELLSESDILKINSVYGVECFQSNRATNQENKDLERMNDEEVIQ